MIERFYIRLVPFSLLLFCLPGLAYANSSQFVTGAGNIYGQIPYSSGDIITASVINDIDNNQTCGNADYLDQTLIVTDDGDASSSVEHLMMGNFGQTGFTTGGCALTFVYTHTATTSGLFTVTTTGSGDSPTRSYVAITDISPSSSSGGGTSTTTISVDLTPINWADGIALFLAFLWFTVWYLMPRKTK